MFAIMEDSLKPDVLISLVTLQQIPVYLVVRQTLPQCPAPGNTEVIVRNTPSSVAGN